MRLRTWVYAAILFVLGTAPVFAASPWSDLRWRTVEGGAVEFWVLHGEAGVNGANRFFVERFHAPVGRLQGRTESLPFADLETAKREFASRTQGYRRDALPASTDTTISEAPGAMIWTPVREWDDAWENRFSEWVATEVGLDFFSRHGIATDCADVAYSLRWIFARMNGLPAVNRLAGTGLPFTHASMRAEWAALPTGTEWHNDARFRAALDYLLNNTYTHTLLQDSYPVRIRQESIRPGGYFLTIHEESGHANVLGRVNLDANDPFPITIISSTVPRAVRDLYEYPFYNPEPVVQGEGAFLKMLWPRPLVNAGGWRLSQETEMSDYSLEQFGPVFSGPTLTFDQEVFRHLIPGYTLNVKRALAEKIRELRVRLEARKQIVDDGWAVCSQTACAPGSANYEAWSTPSRDTAIQEVFYFAFRLVDRPECTRDAECVAIFNQEWNRPVVSIDGANLTLRRVANSWFHPVESSKISSNPNDPPTRRWGIIR